jgi:hypothetical protein
VTRGHPDFSSSEVIFGAIGFLGSKKQYLLFKAGLTGGCEWSVL